MKIATWNVNSIKVRLPQVVEWLKLHAVDVLALQEIKTINENFPRAEFEDLGYHVTLHGQKTYNGVAVLSKQPVTSSFYTFPGYTDPASRILGVTIEDLQLINLYVPNGASVESDKYLYKLTWLSACHDYLQTLVPVANKLIVLGDFNIAPQDEDVYDPKALQGQVLVSAKEREAYQRLLALGLQDSFRLFEQPPQTYSWWDYRQAAFRRNLGLRIDHILVNQRLAEQCVSCVIDKTVRAQVQPSDHAPVIATFVG